ncbi:MAG: HAD-IIA family hydrolase [Anaerolineae bacterium]|nr:HAD-IIA family hydrolase [Anaerolineae bacterium]
MTVDLRTIRAVVLDMDGVLWRGTEVQPGVAEFFAFAARHEIGYAFATNNSTKTVGMYVERLTGIGIPVEPDQIITSAVATADYISQTYPAGTPVYVIGGAGIREGLAERGFPEAPGRAKLVVVGMDFDVTYKRLKTAALHIRAGATFIGTNGDRTFPIPEGLAPGNGSILAAIQAATDVEPLIIGKPETAMFEVALRRLEVAPEQALMVGDRLETDILGGQRAGMRTAVVLTGITTPEMARTASVQADVVYDSLAALHAAWRGVLE